MIDTIKSGQTSKQLDVNLKAVFNAIESAQENDGKVLYIRDGEIAFEYGKTLIIVSPLV